MFLDFGGIMKRGTGANPSDNESTNVEISKVTEQFSRPCGGWLGGRVETERKD